MITNMRIATATVVAAMLAVSGSAAAAGDPAIKCETAKLKAAGQSALCRMKAEVKARKKGIDPDFTKCAVQLSKKFEEAEAKGDVLCPTLGDGGDVDSILAEHAAELAIKLRFPIKRVFLSSTRHAGNQIGSATQADLICDELAAAAGLPGRYMAWLSDSESSPSSRFTHWGGVYVLTSGQVVANGWADLTDGTIDVDIDHDETGAQVSDIDVLDCDEKERAWTGTNTNGTASGQDCDGWGDFSADGDAGHFDTADARWTQDTQLSCTKNLHLYCFEQ